MSHFATKLNGCFIEVAQIQSSGARISTYRFVFDAFAGRTYATYGWRSDSNKKYWEVAPKVCEVYSPSGEKATCHSDDEFTQLTRVNVEAT